MDIKKKYLINEAKASSLTVSVGWPKTNTDLVTSPHINELKRPSKHQTWKVIIHKDLLTNVT